MADNFNEEDKNIDPQTGMELNKGFKFDGIDDPSSDSGFQEEELDFKLDTDPDDNKFVGPSADDVTELDWSEYEDYIEQEYIPIGGEEALQASRAQSQSAWEQAGNSLVKLVPNVALSIAENAGHFFDFEAHWDTLTGEGNDYSNWLTDFAKESKEALGEALPTYRENPNEVFDLGDSAWWFEHGSGLIESVAAFAATGMGVGALTSGGSKMLTRLIARAAKARNAGMKGLRAVAQMGKGLQGASQVMTAGELAYIEGAMTAADTYKSEYEKNLAYFKEKGEANPEELAKQQAAKAAASVVRFNTLINTGLNITSAGMFTRGFGANAKLAKSFGKRQGETRAQWIERLKNDPVASKSLPKILGSTLGEMGQEATEEIVNELSTAFGKERGAQERGEETEGYISALTKALMTEETGLAAILGAVGGAGQKTLGGLTPKAKANKKAEVARQQQQVNNLISDLELYEDAEKRMLKAQKDGDKKAYENAQYDMFNYNATKSFISGTQDQLIQSFEDIAGLSKMEAEARGFDVSEGRDNYKRRANQAIENIKELNKDFDALTTAYNTDSDSERFKYGERLFNIHAAKKSNERLHEEFTQDRDAAFEKYRRGIAKRGTNMTIEQHNALLAEVKGIENHIERNQEVLNNLDKALVTDAQKKRAIDLYGEPAKGVSLKSHVKAKLEEDLNNAESDLRDIKESLKESKEEVKLHGRFHKADKSQSDEDYLNQILNENSLDLKEYIDAVDIARSSEENLKHLDEVYSDLVSKEGKKKFIDEAKKEEAKRVAEATEDDKSEKKSKVKKKRKAVYKKAKGKGEKTGEADGESASETTGEGVETETTPGPTETGTESEVSGETTEEGTTETTDTETNPINESVEKAVVEDVEFETGAKGDGEVHDYSDAEKDKLKESEKEATSKSLEKIVEAGGSIAYVSKEYEVRNGVKKTVSNDVDPNFHRPLESSKEFQVDDKVTLEVDTEFRIEDENGQIFTYEDFKDNDGEVPIAVKKNGEIVGYLRRQSWILKQENEGGEYVNVAVTDYSTPQQQAAINQAIRDYVIKNGSTETKIADKSVGHLSFYLNEKGKPVARTLSEALPKANRLVVFKNGSWHTAPNTPLNESVINKKTDYAQGTIGIVLPTPNGKHFVKFINPSKLSGNNVTTFMKLLEARYANTELADEISNKLDGQDNADVTIPGELLSMLNDITYVSDLKQEEFEEKIAAAEGNKSDTVFINYSTKTGDLSISKRNTDTLVIATEDDFRDNIDRIEKLISSTFKSVKLSKLNNPQDGSIELTIGEDNEISTKAYEDYNQQVKDNLYTTLGPKEISETEDSYFDHPNIHLDYSFVGEINMPEGDSNVETEAEGITLDGVDKDTAAEFKSILSDMARSDQSPLEFMENELKTRQMMAAMGIENQEALIPLIEAEIAEMKREPAEKTEQVADDIEAKKADTTSVDAKQQLKDAVSPASMFIVSVRGEKKRSNTPGESIKEGFDGISNYASREGAVEGISKKDPTKIEEGRSGAYLIKGESGTHYMVAHFPGYFKGVGRVEAFSIPFEIGKDISNLPKGILSAYYSGITKAMNDNIKRDEDGAYSIDELESKSKALAKGLKTWWDKKIDDSTPKTKSTTDTTSEVKEAKGVKEEALATIKYNEDRLNNNKEAIAALYERLRSLPQKSKERNSVLEQIEKLEKKKLSKSEIVNAKAFIRAAKSRLEKAEAVLSGKSTTSADSEQVQPGEDSAKSEEVAKAESLVREMIKRRKRITDFTVEEQTLINSVSLERKKEIEKEGDEGEILPDSKLGDIASDLGIGESPDFSLAAPRNESASDADLNPEMREMLSKGLNDQLVYDITSGKHYNIAKQNEVIDTIVFHAAKGLFNGLSTEKSMMTVKNMFENYRNIYKTLAQGWEESPNRAELAEKLGLRDAEEADELYMEYVKVLKNWKQFKKFSKAKFKSIFDTKAVSLTETEVSDKSIDERYQRIAMLEKESFEDGASLSIDPKKTASGKMKLFLATQKSSEKSFLNADKLIPVDKVWDDLSRLLGGTDASFEAMEKVLQEHYETKPYLKSLANRIKLDKQRQKEFVTTFYKQVTSFVFSDYKEVKRKDKAPYMQHRNYDSNRNNFVNSIVDGWIENQKNSDIVEVKRGQRYINKEKAQEFANIINELAVSTKGLEEQEAASTEDLNKLQNALEMIGVTMPIEALEELSKYSYSKRQFGKKPFYQMFLKGGEFKFIANALTASENMATELDVPLDANNPLQGIHAERSSIKKLAYLSVKYDERPYSSSWRNSEGKTINTYTLPSNMSKVFADLLNPESQHLEEVMSSFFGRNSSWGKMLQNVDNRDFANAFKLEYVDGLKKQRSKKKGLKRGNQSERELEVHEISLFQNQGGKSAKILLPTISDKSMSPLLNILRDPGLTINIKDGKWGLKQKAKDAINMIVNAEIARIQNFKPAKNKSEEYGNYSEGYNKFYFFQSLNDVWDGDTDFDPETMTPALHKAAQEEVAEMIKDTVRAWKEMDIIKINEKKPSKSSTMFDVSYVSKIKKRLGKASNVNDIGLIAAAEIELNYIVAQFNMYQLLVGDPAMHYRGEKKGGIDDALVQVQKRLAKNLAPGKAAEWEKPKYRVVYANDKELKSQHYDHYKKKLGEAGASAYSKVNSTDAQEYTTVQEHLNVMFAYGELTQEEYDNFTSMAKEGKPFDVVEHKKVFQPMKPVQVSYKYDRERGLVAPVYIKSSSIPLFPQLTKGLEIDKIRQAMEKGNIDRIAYTSAVKLGATKVQTLWDGHNAKEGLSFSEDSVSTLDRGGFLIQQDVPYKESKDKILTVSQMNKLLFSNLMRLEDLAKLSGEKVEIRKKLFALGAKSVIKELGLEGEMVVNPHLNDAELLAESMSRGLFKFKDLTKLRDILIDEINNSSSYGANEIQYLELTEDKQAFKMPLNFNGSSKKFEALLFSIITNRILKQTMPGKSYVQASSAGFLFKADKSKGFSDLSKKETSDIIWTDSFDPAKGLQFVREEDGKVRGAQLLVPFYFMKKGKRLKVKDYLTKDGKLDTNKIPEELLRIIGARIPAQGHSSMLPIEIAGFLPEHMGDTVIVPDEITVQMGSDFDVDKLFTYHYNYNVAEDGTLTKVTAEQIVKNKEKLNLEPVKMGDITFNEQQTLAYYNIMEWAKANDDVAYTLEGYAGTGKTTVSKKIMESLRAQGYDVQLGATTHTAADVLRNSTREYVDTIHSLLGLRPIFDPQSDTFDPNNPPFDPKATPKLKPGGILILDESSLLNTSVYSLLLKMAKKRGSRVIFMGDPAQLPPVGEEASKVFTEANPRSHSILTKVERQTEGNPLGPILDAIRSDIDSPMDLFEHKTKLNKKGEGIEFFRPTEEDQKRFLTNATKAFKANMFGTKFITATNDSVAKYNKFFRSQLIGNTSEAYVEGDFMMAYETIPGIVKNGKAFEIKHVVDGEIKSEGLTFETHEIYSDQFDVDPENGEERFMTVLKETPENYAKFEKEIRKRFDQAKKTGRWASYYNLKDQVIVKTPIKLGSGKGSSTIKKGLDYGYAITDHKSQGSTYDEVFVDENNIDDFPSDQNSLKYVAFSRARKKVSSYTRKSEDAVVGEASPKPQPKTISRLEEGKQDIIETKETKKSLQNDYMDIHWKVLTDPKVFDKVLKPLDASGEYSLQSEAKIISDAKPATTKRSVLYRRRQSSEFIGNKAGKSGVAVYSLASTFNAIVEKLDSPILLGRYIKGQFVPDSIDIFDGLSLTTISGPGKSKSGSKALLHQDMQNAAVDNANEQVMNKVGINDDTFAVSVAIAQLSDDDGNNTNIKHVTRFLTQPIVEDFLSRVRLQGDSFGGRFSRDMRADVATQVIKEYSEKGNPSSTMFSEDDLLDMIKDEKRGPEWHGNQAVILEAFLKLDEIGTSLRNAQVAINADSKGNPATYFENLDKVEKIFNLNNTSGIVHLSQLVDVTSEQGFASMVGPMFVESLYRDVLNKGNRGVQSALETIKDISQEETLSIDKKERISAAINNYLVSTSDIFSEEGKVKEERRRLLYSSEASMSIAERVDEAQRSWGKDQIALTMLNPRFGVENGDPHSVTFKAAGNMNNNMAEFTNSFIQMLTSDDIKMRKLAKDLISYSYLTEVNQGATNFLKYIPSAYMMTDEMTSKFSELSLDTSDVESFVRDFYQHNPDMLRIFTKDELKGAKTKIGYRAQHAAFENFSYYPSYADMGKMPIPMFALETEDGYRVYEYDPSEVEYREIDKKGMGQLTEYGSGPISLFNDSRNRTKDFLTSNKYNPNLPADTSEIENPRATMSKYNEYGLNTEEGKNGFSEGSSVDQMKYAIEKIANTTKSSQHVTAARFILETWESLPKDWTLFFTDGKGAAKTLSKSRQIHVSKDHFFDEDGNFNRYGFEHVMLEEVLHALTTTAYNNSKKGGLDPRLAKSIDAAREVYIKTLDADTQNKIKDINKNYLLWKKENSSEDFIKYLNKNSSYTYSLDTLNKLYPLVNSKEFIAGVMLKSDFQKTLNNTPFTGTKSILTRALDVIRRLLDNLYRSLGIRVIKDSQLEETLKTITELVQAGKDITWMDDVEPESEIEYSVAAPVDDSPVKRIIEKLKSRRTSLERSITKKGSNRIEIQAKLDQLDEQMKEILDKESLEQVVSVANSQLDWATSIIQDKKKIPFTELTHVGEILAIWQQAADIYGEDYSGKNREQLKTVIARANELDRDYLEIVKKAIIKASRESNSTLELKREDIESLVDLKDLPASYLSISNSGEKLLQELDRLIADANTTKTYELREYKKKAKEIFEGISPEQIELIFQTDEDGKKTGNMVGEYSQAWYNAKKKKLASAKKRDTSAAWKAYSKWKKDNSITLDPTVVFDLNTSDFSTSKKALKLKEELENEFGEARANRLLEEAKKLQEEYLEAEELFKLKLEADVDAKLITKEQARGQLVVWINDNSPVSYMHVVKGNKPAPDAKLRGSAYVLTIPKNKVNGDVTGYYDSQYSKIMTDPKLAELYNFVKDTLSEHKSYLPKYELFEAQSNFLPQVSMKLIEKLKKTGMKGAYNKSKEDLLKFISTMEEFEVSSDRKIREGSVNKRVPVRYIKPIPEADRSTNLKVIMEMFVNSALHFKHMSKIEDQTMLMQRLVNEASEQKVNSKGERVRDTNGNLYEVKEGLANTKKLVNHTIDMLIYQSRRDKGADTGMLVSEKGVRATAKANKIKKQIKEIDRKVNTGELDYAAAADMKEDLQKQLDDLSTRMVTYDDIGDTAIWLTQLKGMGWNYLSAMNNISFGIMSNFIHAAGGEDYSTRDMMKAYRMMMASTGRSIGANNKLAKKIFNLVEKFDILFEVDETALSGTQKSEKSWKPIRNLLPYEMQRRSEYFVQGMSMVAKMLHDKVQDKNGNEISLFEAFNEDGEWNVDLMGDNAGWDGDPNDSKSLSDHKRFATHIIEVNGRLHGEYDPKKMQEAKRRIAGRLFAQFKTWLPMAVELRFGKQKYNDRLSRDTKGYYRSVADIGFIKTIGLFAKMAIRNKKGLNGLPDVDKANLKKAFREAQFVLSLIGASILTGLVFAGDDDKDKAAKNLLLNQINRLQADLTFFINPNSFNRLMSNPIAAMKSYTDIVNAFGAIFKYTFQSEEDMRKAIDEGDLALKIGNTLPPFTMITKTIRSATMQF